MQADFAAQCAAIGGIRRAARKIGRPWRRECAGFGPPALRAGKESSKKRLLYFKKSLSDQCSENYFSAAAEKSTRPYGLTAKPLTSLRAKT